MGLLDRLRQGLFRGMRVGDLAVEPPLEVISSVHDTDAEERLKTRLADNPNDEAAFDELAVIIGHRAEAHEGTDAAEAKDTAIWALAEEIAHDQRAWYPLVELGRLSLAEDRESALRRLAVAAERDHSGRALAMGLALLRAADEFDAALMLGVGYWRPTEHDVHAGKHLVAAAVDAGRLPEARRHLDAMRGHPDAAAVADMRDVLEQYISQAERDRLRRTPHPGS